MSEREKHMFSADPAGAVLLNESWKEYLHNFAQSLKDYIGEKPEYGFWSYRYGDWLFALDVTGEKNDCAITIMDDGLERLDPLSLGECYVSDAIDGIYLAAFLVSYLEAKPGITNSGEISLLHSRTLLA
jgi:hypothetical protein